MWKRRLGALLLPALLALGCGQTSSDQAAGTGGQGGSAGMSAGGASGMNSGGTGGEYQFPTECSPPLSMELGKLHATLFYGNFYYYSASSCELATVDDGDGSGVLAVVLGLDDFETVYDYRASLSPYWNWVSYSHGTPAGETFRDLEGIPEDTDIDVVAHNPDTGMRLAITFRVSRFTYTILSVSEV